jgi:ZIP family zinc transporter
MAARSATGELQTDRERGRRLPRWLLGVLPLVFIALTIGTFVGFNTPGLDGRAGPPIEELTVERTVLKPGRFELTVRNDGPDAVRVRQVQVNDAFVAFGGAEDPIGRLSSETIRIPQPWLEGEAYSVTLMTSTGATIAHEIPVAVETPATDLSFFALMALLGIYVGVIPIALGMLWLPWIRRIPAAWLQGVMALTVGLLAFLAVDATLEGLDVAAQGSQAFGGAALVFVGIGVAYLLLSGVSTWVSDRRRHAREADRAHPRSGDRLALLIAIGIGMHNLGEGVAIGSSYAVGALALGAFLIVGFAIHNTTEGLAIVAPIASYKPSLRRLGALGLIAGMPAVLGAWIGAAAFNTSVAAFLFGMGAGAIAQVVVALLPSLRDGEGRTLNPASVGGMLAGMAVMFGTGLAVAV